MVQTEQTTKQDGWLAGASVQIGRRQPARLQRIQDKLEGVDDKVASIQTSWEVALDDPVERLMAVDWMDVVSPKRRLAFDHSEQLDVAVQKLQAKVAADVLPLHLLPERFTLSQLQKVVEVILGHPLDKSSFRRRLKTSEDIIEADEFVRGDEYPSGQPTHDNALLKRMKFAAQSERFSPEQRSLLEDEIEADLAAVALEIEQLQPPAAAPEVKQQPKRQPLPAHLPRRDIRHEPDSTTCQCGCQMQRIGEDVAEKLDYVPGVFNNWIENQIRPISTGRNNWLFAGSLRAGQRAAAMMSLVQSARMNGHDPYAYLKDVLTRLPTHRASRVGELLPHRWEAAQP